MVQGSATHPAPAARFSLEAVGEPLTAEWELRPHRGVQVGVVVPSGIACEGVNGVLPLSISEWLSGRVKAVAVFAG